MTRLDYRLPTKRERELKLKLDEATHRIDQLMRDTTGASIICDLEQRISRLEAKVAEIDKVKVKNANLVSKNRELGLLGKSQKKLIASLKLDIKIAHSYGADLERMLVKKEQRRYEWATAARRLGVEVTELRAENRKLKAQLNKSPENSSMPPSSCTTKKKIVNLREKSGKTPGGQPGHIGHKRRRYDADEKVAIADPCACPACKGTLVKSGKEQKRSVTDLVITVWTTEYSAYDYDCTRCGLKVYAEFPDCAQNESNYGNNVRAVVTYLTNRCNMSNDNVRRFLWEATGHKLKVSKGSVHNFLASFAKKAEGDIQDIKDALKTSSVMGADATHTSTSGVQSYVYTANSEDAVFYWASAVKGAAPLYGSPVDGYEGVLVHDHDTAYYRFGKHHQECNAHVLRYLKGVRQNEPGVTWANAMSALLCEAHDAAKDARENNPVGLSVEISKDIESRYSAVLVTAEAEYATGVPKNPKYRPAGIALSIRLNAFRSNHLAFLYDPAIPFENNRSERLLRCVKGKTKQSGGFRSITNGQNHYCDFLSIAQTAAIRDMEVLGVVLDVFEGNNGMFKELPACPLSSGP